MLANARIHEQIPMRMIGPVSEFVRRKRSEIHYIGGSEVLPPPLEPEKEAKAIEGLSGTAST